MAVSIPGKKVSSSRFSHRLLKSGLIILGSIIIYVLVSKFSDLKHNIKTVSYLRLGLFGIASLSLLILHARDVTTLFSLFGQKIKNVRMSSEEKGKKAADFIKTVDSVMEQFQEEQKSATSDSERDQK